MTPSRTQSILFALLGLNRAGKILYGSMFVLAVPALLAWFVWLPRLRFSDEDERLFRAMYAYSPYHHVKDGEKYPAVLFLTGANDPRVYPMQSRKMTARLQAASPGGVVLLRTSASSGHGLDTALSERIEETADVYAFLCARLGVAVNR